MVQEELNDIYEDIMIYTSIPQDILRYHRIFSHEIFFIFLQSEIFQIVEKWLCPFSTRCDQLNINHLSTIWNISDCRKMAVTIQYEVWLAQWFKKNWKISMSIIYTPQDISGCCIVKYFSIMKYFQSWNIWITWSFKLDLVYRISVCNFKSFRFYFSCSDLVWPFSVSAWPTLNDVIARVRQPNTWWSSWQIILVSKVQSSG